MRPEWPHAPSHNSPSQQTENPNAENHAPHSKSCCGPVGAHLAALLAHVLQDVGILLVAGQLLGRDGLRHGEDARGRRPRRRQCARRHVARHARRARRLLQKQLVSDGMSDGTAVLLGATCLHLMHQSGH